MDKLFLSKIVVVLILSFFLSSFLVNNVYIGHTPVFKKNLINVLMAKINEIFKNQNIASKKNQTTVSFYDKLDKSLFAPISKGIYAQPLEGSGTYILIKNEEVDWIEHTIVVKDKEIKIKIPKGETLPDQEVLEKIFR